MQIGIDKIALTSQEFRAVDLSKFSISSVKKPGEDVPYLITDKHGTEYFGNKAFVQTDSTILDINQRGILVVFNPCKLLHPYKLNSDLSAITDTIKQEVKDAGIDLDINSCSIARIDLTKQAEMNQPVHTYNDAFGYMRGKRLVSKSYPSGYYFGNKSTESVFYDKRAEMVHKFKMNIPESNFMRAEVKYKRTKNVIAELQVQTYQALLQTDTDQLNTSYNNYLNKRVFSKIHEGEQLTLNFKNEVELLKAYLVKHPRGGITKYLFNLGIDTAIEMFGSLEGIRELLEASEVPRTTVYRTIQQLNKEIQQKAILDKQRGINTGKPLNTIAFRLKEVQDTFTGVAYANS